MTTLCWSGFAVLHPRLGLVETRESLHRLLTTRCCRPVTALSLGEARRSDARKSQRRLPTTPCWSSFGISFPYYLPRSETITTALDHEETLMAFAEFCVEDGLQVNSTEVYVSAVNTQHTLETGMRVSPQLRIMDRLKRTYAGLCRDQLRHEGDWRYFISASQLDLLVRTLSRIADASPGEDKADALMLIAAIETGFEGICRGSEYTTDGDGMWEAHRHLSVHDFHHNEYSDAHGQVASWIFIKTGKTDQFGHYKADPVYLNRAAAAIAKYLAARPSISDNPRSEPLFRMRDGSPLKQDTFRRRLRAALKMIGAPNHSKVGIHALRAGGATALHAAGMSDDSIRRRGRWRSDCYLRYLRDNFAESQRCLHAMFDHRTRLKASSDWLSRPENASTAAAVLWDRKFEERRAIGA